MTATALDTLKAAKVLKDAGFDEAQAEAVVATLGDAVHEQAAPLASGIVTILDNTATKESVSIVADNVAAIAANMATKESVSAVADNVATIAANMATKESVSTVVDNVATIAANMATKEYVNAAIAGLRAEMAVDFKALYRHLWAMGAGIVGVTVALSKLLP